MEEGSCPFFLIDSSKFRKEAEVMLSLVFFSSTTVNMYNRPV